MEILVSCREFLAAVRKELRVQRAQDIERFLFGKIKSVAKAPVTMLGEFVPLVPVNEAGALIARQPIILGHGEIIAVYHSLE